MVFEGKKKEKHHSGRYYSNFIIIFALILHRELFFHAMIFNMYEKLANFHAMFSLSSFTAFWFNFSFFFFRSITFSHVIEKLFFLSCFSVCAYLRTKFLHLFSGFHFPSFSLSLSLSSSHSSACEWVMSDRSLRNWLLTKSPSTHQNNTQIKISSGEQT